MFNLRRTRQSHRFCRPPGHLRSSQAAHAPGDTKPPWPGQGCPEPPEIRLGASVGPCSQHTAPVPLSVAHLLPTWMTLPTQRRLLTWQSLRLVPGTPFPCLGVKQPLHFLPLPSDNGSPLLRLCKMSRELMNVPDRSSARGSETSVGFQLGTLRMQRANFCPVPHGQRQPPNLPMCALARRS